MPDTWIGWAMYGFFVIGSCGGWLVLGIIGNEAWKTWIKK